MGSYYGILCKSFEGLQEILWEIIMGYHLGIWLLCDDV